MSVSDEWEALRAQGMSGHQAAAIRGVHWTCAYRWARRKGVAWGTVPRWTDDEMATLHRSLDAGLSAREAALLIDREQGAIRQQAIRLGRPFAEHGIYADKIGRARERRTGYLALARWAIRHGLSAADVIAITGRPKASICQAAPRAGLQWPRERDSPLTRHQRILRALRASMASGGYIPPEAERLIGGLMEAREKATQAALRHAQHVEWQRNRRAA